MTISNNRGASSRLHKKTVVFDILSREPGLSATQLQQRTADAGIQLRLLAAYRAIRTYRDCDGKLESSETRSVQIVATILQNAAAGEHLAVMEILRRAAVENVSLHKATVYRVLMRLCSVGLVQAIGVGRQKCYEWKRDEVQHSHLTCVRCGKTIEFHQDYLDEAAKQICLRLGYQFHGIEFVVRSLCPECNANS